jgi:hypothetical protein
MLELWDRLPPNLRGTLRTLVTIALNGGCAALASVVIDPDHFNLSHLKHLGIVFGVGALAAVVNWLRQSPWKTADDRMMTTIARSVPFVMIAALMGLAALTAGCGPKQYHTAVVANTSIAQAIFACRMPRSPRTSEARHRCEAREYKAQILTLLEAGDDLTLALKDWNHRSRCRQTSARDREGAATADRPADQLSAGERAALRGADGAERAAGERRATGCCG